MGLENAFEYSGGKKHQVDVKKLEKGMTRTTVRHTAKSRQI